MITMVWVTWWTNRLQDLGYQVRRERRGSMFVFTWRSPEGRLRSGIDHPDEAEAYCNSLSQVVRERTEFR